MRKFVAVAAETGAPTAFVPGVPARDLTEEEWDFYTKPLFEEDPAGSGVGHTVKVRDALIDAGSDTAAALWEKVPDPPDPPPAAAAAAAPEKPEKPSRGAATPAAARGATDGGD